MDVGRLGAFVLVGLVGALVSIGACGGENKSKSPGGSSGSAGASSAGSGGTSSGGTSGGGAGAGGSAGSSGGALTCGAATCEPVSIIGLGAIPACCPAGMDDACGLDATIIGALGLTFDDPCQPRNQPGTPDPSCPSTDQIELPDAGLSTSFSGCCRPDRRCGYLADTVLLGPLPIALGLGCVDATPFLDGGSPAACGDAGSGGQAGSAGTGGSAGESGAGGAGGDMSAAGMGGA